MRRTPLLLLVALCCPVVGIVVWFTSQGKAEPAKARPPEPVNANLVPLTRILMFNTGVGHFEREGTVEGSPRVDLNFPATDINDLLKSLTVDDGGNPGVVSYDGTEASEAPTNFALNLSTNPTFGQLINQARGEKVEVTLEGGATGNGPFNGVIVGMEAAPETAIKEAHHLNLLTTDGVRRLPLEPHLAAAASSTPRSRRSSAAP